MSDVLRFAVQTVGAGFQDYPSAVARADAGVAALFAVYGPYSERREYYGGNATPNQTKCAFPFMDPTDRAILGNLLDDCTFLEEIEVANDEGWAPPPSVIGLAAQGPAASSQVLASMKKKSAKRKAGR